MRKKKSREEICRQTYLTKADISTLLDIHIYDANNLFAIANKIDATLGYRPDGKVLTTTVLNLVGISQTELKEMVL